MSELRVYNTLTNQKEPFIPLIAGQVSMYVCGVTVYDYCHIGHARGAIVFDIIRRYLEYRGYTVKYVRNFTDIDDKIINRAQEECCKADEVAEKYTREYCQDMVQLGIRSADVEPKATEHMTEIIALVQKLIEKGHAYQVDGDIFFEIATFRNYGKLSNRDFEDMRAGARVEIDPRKKDPLDFAIWKGAKAGEPAWDSPWGPGRPGWHIECSAMSMKHLGETFDIHGGGKDLIFPHHENEIAQSEAYTGRSFVHYWLHNGFVNINQEKMSKSLKNFFTIRSVLEKFSGETLRLFLLSTHYRSPINFSLDHLEDSSKALERVYHTFQTVNELVGNGDKGQIGEIIIDLGLLPQEKREKINKLQIEFERAMNDDFNTAEAIGRIYEAIKEVNIFINNYESLTPWHKQFLLAMIVQIKKCGCVLGLFNQEEQKKSNLSSDLNSDLMAILIDIRELCRTKKQWDLADHIRSSLQEKGIMIEDRKNGTTWRYIKKNFSA